MTVSSGQPISPVEIVGAVIRDPVADRIAWSEYLEVVARDRDG